MKKNTHVVHNACISAVGFPTNFGGLLEMTGPLDGDAHWPTNMDELLMSETLGWGEGRTWTAPRWMSEGDTLFYYHTKGAEAAVRRLVKLASRADCEEAEPFNDREQLVLLLERQLDYAERLGGTVFAVSRVRGPTVAERREDRDSSHFRGLIFAPVEQPHVLDVPLPLDAFAKYLPLSRGGTTTPIYSQAFRHLMSDLAVANDLPEWLATATLRDRSFRDVGKHNWHEFARDEALRYVVEAQLRAYLIDFLLEELKDPGTSVLHECRCDSGGIADYFVRVDGVWVAIEAKLSAATEPKLLDQVRSYIGTTSITPSVGSAAGKRREVTTAAVAVVIDSHGVYLMNDAGFARSSPRVPLIRRIDLSPDSVIRLRRELMG